MGETTEGVAFVLLLPCSGNSYHMSGDNDEGLVGCKAKGT